MRLKAQIPNLITLLNLLSGCIAVIHAVQGNFVMAALFVALGIFFDFFDGLAARVLDVKSELGLQLDSLADMVTSGLVPGIVMFQLLNLSIGQPIAQNADASWNYTGLYDGLQVYEPKAFIGFFIRLGSASWLANFKSYENQ